MKESKRETRNKTVSQNRTESIFKPTERYVGQAEFFNTSDIDNTAAMSIFVSALVNYAGEDGFPTHFHFYLTKNKNVNLTDSNKVVSLRIPIIPVVWNINSRESVNSFIKNGKEPKKVSELYDSMDRDEKEERISQYTSKIMTYITNELALRYIVAKRNGDKLIMDQISKLKIMQEQDFDFDLFEAIVNNPKGLRHKTDGHFIVYEEKGKDVYVQISDAQSQKYPSYKDSLDKYCVIQKQFTTLNSDIETFRTYDITESKTKQTIGGNSLLNKLKGKCGVVATKKPAKQSDIVTTIKPAEPGDE